MYTCESPTQVYLFLVMTFGRGQDIDRLHYLGYDRACDLHPFLCNLEKKGAYFAKWLNRRVKFLVDSFHISRHTESCCMPPDNADCKFQRFNEIHGVNTECAKQSFRWLNRLKLFMKQMQQYKFNFFLHTIANMRNMHIEQTSRKAPMSVLSRSPTVVGTTLLLFKPRPSISQSQLQHVYVIFNS